MARPAQKAYGPAKRITKSYKRVAGWDSCIFLSWLLDEQAHGQEVIDGIAEMADLVDKGILHLATSVLTLPEVLESKMLPSVYNAFEALFERPNVHLIDVDRKIAKTAHEIRSYYAAQKTTDSAPKIKVIQTPDAIQLATAIEYRCDEFFTLDEKLLKLNENVAGKYPLKIRKPKTIQPALFDSASPLLGKTDI